MTKKELIDVVAEKTGTTKVSAKETVDTVFAAIAETLVNGKQGFGRTDSIWNELNVIGVTEGIYNDTVAITKENSDVYNPEFIAAIQDSLINIINTDEGQKIFSVYSHTGYAKATDADYDGARKALKAVSE